MSNPYARHNEQNKANFDDVYDLPDPRGYFEALGPLDYQTPEHGRRVFSALLQALRTGDGSAPKILDLCCSYGVIAALLKHDLTLEDLYARYASRDLAELTTEELAAADAEGRLHTLDKQSGALVQTQKVASGAILGMAADENRVSALSAKGDLVILTL